MVISTAAGVAGLVGGGGGHRRRSRKRHCWPPCSLVRVAIDVPTVTPLNVCCDITTEVTTIGIITVRRGLENGRLLGYLISYEVDSGDEDDEARQLYFPLLHCFGRGCADFAQAGHRLQ